MFNCSFFTLSLNRLILSPRRVCFHRPVSVTLVNISPVMRSKEKVNLLRHAPSPSWLPIFWSDWNQCDSSSLGIHWNNMYISPVAGDTASFGWLCWLMLIDSIIYFLIGAYIRMVFPGMIRMFNITSVRPNNSLLVVCVWLKLYSTVLKWRT